MRKTLLVTFIFLIMGIFNFCKPHEEPLVFIVKGSDVIENIEAEKIDSLLERKELFIRENLLSISGPNGMSMEIPLRETQRVYKYKELKSNYSMTLVLKKGIVTINLKQKNNTYFNALIKEIADELSSKPYSESEGYKHFDQLFDLVN